VLADARVCSTTRSNGLSKNNNSSRRRPDIAVRDANASIYQLDGELEQEEQQAP
jgi:hypothetical protein